jgi:hypothetical protein
MPPKHCSCCCQAMINLVPTAIAWSSVDSRTPSVLSALQVLSTAILVRRAEASSERFATVAWCTLTRIIAGTKQATFGKCSTAVEIVDAKALAPNTSIGVRAEWTTNAIRAHQEIEFIVATVAVVLAKFTTKRAVCASSPIANPALPTGAIEWVATC